MIKNGMRPIHPGEILREEFLLPIGMTAQALSKALHVTPARINDIVNEKELCSKVVYGLRSDGEEEGGGDFVGQFDCRDQNQPTKEPPPCARISKKPKLVYRKSDLGWTNWCGVVPGK